MVSAPSIPDDHPETLQGGAPDSPPQPALSDEDAEHLLALLNADDPDAAAEARGLTPRETFELLASPAAERYLAGLARFEALRRERRAEPVRQEMIAVLRTVARDESRDPPERRRAANSVLRTLDPWRSTNVLLRNLDRRPAAHTRARARAGSFTPSPCHPVPPSYEPNADVPSVSPFEPPPPPPRPQPAFVPVAPAGETRQDAAAAVEQWLGALQHNDTPEPDSGVSTLFIFTRDVEAHHYPRWSARFREIAGDLIGHTSRTVEVVSHALHYQMYLAHVRVGVPCPDGRTAAFLWHLQYHKFYFNPQFWQLSHIERLDSG